MIRSIILITACTLVISVSCFSQAGSLDLDFGTDGIVINNLGSDCEKAYSVAIQSDGKIVVAGEFRIGFDDAFLVARYNNDGSLDNSFGLNGVVTTSFGSGGCSANAVVIQQDGKIVLAGFSINESFYEFAIVRYNTDGSLDNSFDADGIVTTSVGSSNDMAFSLALQQDGKIVVAGLSSNGSNDDFAIVRYNTDGSLDNTFSVDGKVTTAVGSDDEIARAIVLQQDGKIVLAGYTDNGTDFDFALVRYNTDGTLDTSFDEDGKVITVIGSENDLAMSVAIQQDGKIVVAGYSDNESKHEIALARYNSNGTLDESFNSDGVVTTSIGNGCEAESIVIQPDGKIIIAGQATTGPSTIDIAVIRYNTEGTLDNSFDTDGIVITSIADYYNMAYSVAMQQDGKILVAGYYEPEEEIQDIVLARYLSGLSLGTVDFSVQENILFIYPNPLQDDAIMKYELIKEENISLELYDLKGEFVQTFISQERKSSGIHEEKIHITKSIPSGTYVLILSNGKSRQGIRINIQ
jgi:uncharacterized delta-60 repeat protein